MLLLLLGALSVLVLVALAFIGWRLKRVAQRVDALQAGVDRVRVDVAQIRREADLDPDGGARPEPTIVRRKGHLGLVGGIAAGLGIGAAWIRDHRAASIATAAAVVAAVSLVVAAPWDTDGDHVPPSSAPSLTPTATGVPPSRTSTPSPTPGRPSGSPEGPGETVLPTSGGATPSTALSPEPIEAGPGMTPSTAAPQPGPSGTTTVVPPSQQPGGSPSTAPPGRGRGTGPGVPPGQERQSSYAVCVNVSADPLLGINLCLLGDR